jgi:Na+-transporting NADH:ubiquinone oxidoreductase subunit C
VPSFNTSSNQYTIGFLAVMVVIVGLSLALVSSALEPTIQANLKLDERTKILKSVFPKDASEEAKFFTADFVNSTYEANVKAQLINFNGEVVADEVPEGFDYRAESKKAPTQRVLPLYTYTDDEGTLVYVIQMIGLGLWDEINGYLALNEDKKTIRGVAFDHRGETPGLGAEIVKPSFRQQFVNKNLFDEKGNFDFTVHKAGKYVAGDQNAVDGISGATITINGVDAMVESTVAAYQNFFANN